MDRRGAAVEAVTGIGYYADLLRILIAKELKLRYRGTMLGILWSLANPIALALVMGFAVTRVLKAGIPDYGLTILPALFAWHAISNSLYSSSLAFTGSASLIRKIRFPRYMICVALVCSELVHFAITIPIYGGVRAYYGHAPFEWVWLLGVPLLVLIQITLVLGGVMLIATINAFLRDMQQLVGVSMLLLFYMTPVLYPAEMVPEDLRWMIALNPFATLVVSWRALLMDGVLSPYLGWAAAYALLFFAVGAGVYRRYQARLAEVI